MTPTDLLKNKYFSELLASIRANTPINFNMQISSNIDKRDFLLFVDSTGRLKIEYQQMQRTFENDPGGLVDFLLTSLKKYKDDDRDMDSYHRMKKFFVGLDYPGLPDVPKAKFDRGIDLLMNKIFYFCSYTTKGLPEINNSYEQTLTRVFGIDTLSDFEQWKRTNYLAKLIVRYFNEQSFNNYFFDEDKLVNGDGIKNKVFNYCSRTLVFVILAQQETFRDWPSETNWCFAEYEHYNLTHPENRQYIVYRIPCIKRPAGARKAIRDWFDFLSTDQGIKSTTIRYSWTSDIIKRQLDKDVDIIGDTYENLFANLVNDN